MPKKNTTRHLKVNDPLPRVIAAAVSTRVIKQKDLRLDASSSKLSKPKAIVMAAVPPPWAAFKPKMTNERIHDRVERRIAANRKRDD
ncbi:MAG: hypothetical protein QM703_07000 [Gemmatales bacterium]